MDKELLEKYTYFLNRTLQEVKSITFNGKKLEFRGEDELGYGMFARRYDIERDKMFLLHFDRDTGNKVTVQKTYWGNGFACYKEYNELAKFRSPYMPNFETRGFCITTEKYGNVLFKLLNDGNLLCIMASINI